VARAVYGGSDQPTFLPLNQLQIDAVVAVGNCTGTIVGSEWVVTAGHCDTTTVCRPKLAGQGENCVSAAHSQRHPALDIAVVHVAHDLLKTVGPEGPFRVVPAMTGPPSIGRRGEIVGVGATERGRPADRQFATARIEAVELETFTVTTGLNSGACFGDSGAPLFMIDEHGQVAVAGFLSSGDASCAGLDTFVRADRVSAWLSQTTGIESLFAGSSTHECDGIDYTGRCFDNQAVWCEAGTRRTSICSSHEPCGYERGAGFRCGKADAPCVGIDRAGDCIGSGAPTCLIGPLTRVEGGTCGRQCARRARTTGCVMDLCSEIGALGRCRGNVAEWCVPSRTYGKLDCSSQGKQCGYVDDVVGYFCK
jgi:hypothetical protein